MLDFNERLKKAMNIRNMTQSELCSMTSIPKSAMSQYMSGAFKPKQKRTHSIAKALNVSEAWLMGYDVPMERIDFAVISPEQRAQLPTKDDMTIAMFKQLDDEDKTEIRGEIRQMLKAPKYKSGDLMVEDIMNEIKKNRNTRKPNTK